MFGQQLHRAKRTCSAFNFSVNYQKVRAVTPHIGSVYALPTRITRTTGAMLACALALSSGFLCLRTL
eukprot:4911432-Amphidinium_carterae.1